MNGRVLVRCRAVTSDGAAAEVEAVIGAVPMPAVAVDGNLTFNGTNSVVGGACGGVHANGNVASGGEGPTISTQVSATGGVGGNYRRPDGTATLELNAMDEVVIPDLNPMNFCGGADYRLLAGGVVTDGAGNPVNPLPPGWGWTYSAGQSLWSVNNSTIEGTFCVEGNAYVAGSSGTSVDPLVMSILATGSIKIEGMPVIRPDHPDGILLMAAGDVRVAGQPNPGVLGYSGMIYAGAQCIATGSATVFGQLLCANGPQPAGAIEYAAANTVEGSFRINFDCSGNVFNKRRILYWYPRIGV